MLAVGSSRRPVPIGAAATPLGGVLLLAGALLVIAAAASVGSTPRPADGLWVAGGFAACAAGLALLDAPIGGPMIALVFALYVGVSAALAIALPARDVLDGIGRWGALQSAPFLDVRGRPAGISGSATRAALLLGGISGIGCLGMFLIASGRGRARTMLSVARPRLSQAASLLVALGLLGIFASLVRFALDARNGLSGDSIRAFWHGGAYLLLLAQLAIPGLALHLSMGLERGDPPRRLARYVTGFAVLMALSLPTGERGYLIECALAVLAVFVAHRHWVRRIVLPAVVLGAVLLIVTQAARDSLSQRGTLSPGVVAGFMRPSNWEHSLENQFASFQWAADVEAYGPALHAGNPLLALLQKPIPRQLDPGKPNGLSSAFTPVVYPSAARAHVSFAIPLYAELDYAVGPIGAFVGLALLGGLLGLGFDRLRGWPAALRPVAAVGFLWAAFVLIRGDLSSSVPLAVIWLLSIGAIVWWSRMASPRKLVLDALAVPPTYSGIGATVIGIGRSLAAAPLAIPVVVRCAADARPALEPAFAPGTAFHCPLPASRPAWRRLVYQLVVAPARDRRSTLLVSASEVASGWGLASRAVIVHDLRRTVAPATARRSERGLYGAVVPSAVKRADGILTVSAVSAAMIEDTLAPDCDVRVVAQHHGLALSPDGLAASPEVCALGAIRPYKGLDTVLDAVERLPPNARPRVRWAGAIELDAAAAAAVTERARTLGVELVGWLPEAELATVLDSSAVLLAPSRFEGYGLSLLEGLRRGMAVFASDIPAHREVAADAALYFTPGDPVALAKLLADLVAGEVDVAAHGDVSRRRAEELATAGPSWSAALSEVIAELTR